MIDNIQIQEGLCLRDLLAQAVALGVCAARGQTPYMGAWCIADDILNEIPEVLSHRDQMFGVVNSVLALTNPDNMQHAFAVRIADLKC